MSTTLITPVGAFTLRQLTSRMLLTRFSVHESVTKSKAMERTNSMLLTDPRMLRQWGLVA